jgi:hypothetical protein
VRGGWAMLQDGQKKWAAGTDTPPHPHPSSLLKKSA